MIEMVTFRITSGLHGNGTADTAGATSKLLFIKHLIEIRVVKTATLKTLNILTHNQLRGARLLTANIVNLVD